MNTSEINDFLRKIPSFVGAFPCNHIPDPDETQSAFVINLSPFDASDDSIQGSHWVAIVIRDGKGIYFDSMGLPPLQSDILKFLSQHSIRYKFNTQNLQSIHSRVCGVYCIDFITMHALGENLRGYLSSFQVDHRFNDRLVVDRVTCLSSILQPQSTLDLKTLL